VFDCFNLVMLLPALLSIAGAGDFSTTGAEHLRTFIEKAESGTNPVTVVSFGDSMADSYRSIGFVIMNDLQARLGYAGYALDNYQNAAMGRLTNGATYQGPSAFWFADSFQLPPGSSVWWDAQPGWVEHSPIGGGAKGDRLGLFYVTQPGGG
jgi:hypothetical protein